MIDPYPYPPLVASAVEYALLFAPSPHLYYLAGMDQEGWNRRYAGRELVWTADANRFLVEEVQGMDAGHALDLACGEGRNALWLAKRGWQVCAVDFSEMGMAKGRRLARARGREIELDWVCADLATYQPEQRAYDLVLLFYLHIPWREFVPVLHRAAKALAKGGTLLLVGHAKRNLDCGVGGPQDRDLLYDPATIAAELDGLRIERAEEVQRTVETNAGTRFAIDVLVRAKRIKSTEE